MKPGQARSPRWQFCSCEASAFKEPCQQESSFHCLGGGGERMSILSFIQGCRWKCEYCQLENKKAANMDPLHFPLPSVSSHSYSYLKVLEYKSSPLDTFRKPLFPFSGEICICVVFHSHFSSAGNVWEIQRDVQWSLEGVPSHSKNFFMWMCILILKSKTLLYHVDRIFSLWIFHNWQYMLQQLERWFTSTFRCQEDFLDGTYAVIFLA